MFFTRLVLLLLAPSISLVSPDNPDNPEDEERVFVHALWRHGDRAPNMAWPTDPNREESWWQGWGSLSVKGMQQQVQLGQRLREHLGDFVSRHYVSHEVYLYSSDINRTLTSAISNMIGFYTEEQRRNGKDYPSDFNWPYGFMPIPVHTISLNDEYLRSMPPMCPKMEDAERLLEHTPEYKQLKRDYKGLLRKMSKLTGRRLQVKDVFIVHDTLFVEQENNRSWSPGITQDLYEQLGRLNQAAWNLRYGIGVKPYKGKDISTELVKLNGGWVLGEMIDRMMDKRKCLERPAEEEPSYPNEKDPCYWIGRLKYFAYSGHEESITSALRTYGFEHTNYNQDGMPTYASCLTIELWRNNKDHSYSVKVFYFPRDQETIELTKEIVGCEEGRGCTLDEFNERSDKYRLKPTAESECWLETW